MLNDLEIAATALLGELAVATNKKQTTKENNNMTNNTTVTPEDKVEAVYQQIRTKADLKIGNGTTTEEEYSKACKQVIDESPDIQKALQELYEDPETLAFIYDDESEKDSAQTTQTEKGNENMTNNNTAVEENNNMTNNNTVVEEVVAVEVATATATTAATTQATEELGFFGKVKAKLKSYVTAIKDKYKSFKAAVKEDGFFSAVKAQAKALASAKYSGKAIISQAILAGSTLIATLLAPVSFTMTGFFVSYAMYHAAASVLASLFTDRSAKDVLKDIAIFGVAMPVVAYASFTVSLFTAAAIL